MMRAEEVFARYKEEIGEAVIFSPKVGGYSTITFPLYGPDGDYFDLYFKVDGEKVLISDGGHIYDVLSLDETIKRLNSKMKKVAEKMGIDFKDGTLSKVSTADDFSDDMNRFIIAISALRYGIGI